MFTVIELAHVVCVDNAAIKKEIYSKAFNELAINWTNKYGCNIIYHKDDKSRKFQERRNKGQRIRYV